MLAIARLSEVTANALIRQLAIARATTGGTMMQPGAFPQIILQRLNRKSLH